jgi:IS30 family transposase
VAGQGGDGRVDVIDAPVSPRFLSQDDRIEIADGLACGEPVKVIAARLERRWSPGQISRWLRRRYPRKPQWHVCTETIYEAVYRGLILPVSPRLPRTARTYRHRRGRGRSRDGALRQCTAIKPIRLRPAAAGSRRQAGHWEGDLIIGAAQRSAIATLVERKTRYAVLVPLPHGHAAASVADALIGAFAALPSGLRRTLTWDQGNENGEPGLAGGSRCARTGVASKRPIGTRPGDGPKGGQHVCAGDPGPCVRRRADARAA